jgi:hypothetical protein
MRWIETWMRSPGPVITAFDYVQRWPLAPRRRQGRRPRSRPEPVTAFAWWLDRLGGNGGRRRRGRPAQRPLLPPLLAPRLTCAGVGQPPNAEAADRMMSRVTSSDAARSRMKAKASS